MVPSQIEPNHEYLIIGAKVTAEVKYITLTTVIEKKPTSSRMFSQSEMEPHEITMELSQFCYAFKSIYSFSEFSAEKIQNRIEKFIGNVQKIENK